MAEDIYKKGLLRAAEIAKIRLSEQETEKLIKEIEEVIELFSKIGNFNEYSKQPPFNIRPYRKDIIKKSKGNSFSNSRFVKNGKFLGPRLID